MTKKQIQFLVKMIQTLTHFVHFMTVFLTILGVFSILYLLVDPLLCLKKFTDSQVYLNIFLKRQKVFFCCAWGKRVWWEALGMEPEVISTSRWKQPQQSIISLKVTLFFWQRLRWVCRRWRLLVPSVGDMSHFQFHCRFKRRLIWGAAGHFSSCFLISTWIIN